MLLVVIFAVANQQVVTIDLWPFELTYSLPLYALVAVSLLIGFLIGAVVMWISAGKVRNKARESYYKASSLEREVAYLKRKHAETKAPIPGARVRAFLQAGEAEEALLDVVTDDRGGRMFICSDTDYCTGRRERGHVGPGAAVRFGTDAAE